jgi:hypothetical protein
MKVLTQHLPGKQYNTFRIASPWPSPWSTFQIKAHSVTTRPTCWILGPYILIFFIRIVIIKYRNIGSWMFELIWLISIYSWIEIQQNFFHMVLMIAQHLRKAVPRPEVLPSVTSGTCTGSVAVLG